MNVFFYGLFMDEQLLAEKGITPKNAAVGSIDGYRLRIGERATLQPCTGARAYGVMMDISVNDVRKLYSDSGVADYVPEPVTVELITGSRAEASCYNLPGNDVAGVNKGYAEALFEVANRLGLPESYLEQIRRAGA